MVHLFTYGTLTSRHRMEDLLSRPVPPPRPALLRGYRLYHAPPLDYPLILPEEGAETPGYLYEVHERELPILDHYEGVDDDPPLYERRWVQVECEGKQVRAQAYVGNPEAWPVARLRPEE